MNELECECEHGSDKKAGEKSRKGERTPDRVCVCVREREREREDVLRSSIRKRDAMKGRKL